MSTVVAEKSTHQVREGAFGNATGLACRECGHQIALGPHSRQESPVALPKAPARAPVVEPVDVVSRTDALKEASFSSSPRPTLVAGRN